MDPLAELENMAVKPENDGEPDDQTVKRWQRLFQYSFTEATEHIKTHRSNLSRIKVSDEHWEMVRAEKEAGGYDRELYEYAMALKKTRKPVKSSTAPVKTSKPGTSKTHQRSKFLIKLEGPFDTPKKVQEIGGLAIPSVATETGHSGDVSFCLVNFTEKEAFLKGLAQINFQPTIVRISVADKDLSNTSIYPTLGIDSTLPQHRLSDFDICPTPKQDEYPVWYFFYGTLADPPSLTRLLSLSEEEKPELKPASVKGGTIKTWARKYRAIVDAPDSAFNIVHGYAYRVVASIYEDVLRYYETEKYEVVRCAIRMKGNGEVINGLTFRFAGDPDELV